MKMKIYILFSHRELLQILLQKTTYFKYSVAGRRMNSMYMSCEMRVNYPLIVDIIEIHAIALHFTLNK